METKTVIALVSVVGLIMFYLGCLFMALAALRRMNKMQAALDKIIKFMQREGIKYWE